MKTNIKQPNDFLYDNYDIYYTPFWRTTWFMATMGVILVCLIITACMYWWRMKQKKVLTSWEIVSDQLTDLENQIRTHRITSQNVYVALTTIFKNYLHTRYGYLLFNKTDEEIAAFLLTADLPEIVRKQLLDLFSHASVLKFSQQTVDEQAMITVVDQARTALQATIPVEPESKK